MGSLTTGFIISLWFIDLYKHLKNFQPHFISTAYKVDSRPIHERQSYETFLVESRETFMFS